MARHSPRCWTTIVGLHNQLNVDHSFEIHGYLSTYPKKKKSLTTYFSVDTILLILLILTCIILFFSSFRLENRRIVENWKGQTVFYCLFDFIVILWSWSKTFKKMTYEYIISILQFRFWSLFRNLNSSFMFYGKVYNNTRQCQLIGQFLDYPGLLRLV